MCIPEKPKHIVLTNYKDLGFYDYVIKIQNCVPFNRIYSSGKKLRNFISIFMNNRPFFILVFAVEFQHKHIIFYLTWFSLVLKEKKKS